MKRLIGTFLLAAMTASAAVHDEDAENLRISPELDQKNFVNMAAAFRLAYAAGTLRVGQPVAWASPSSGKAEMLLLGNETYEKFDTSGMDTSTLEPEMEKDAIALIAHGAVMRRMDCYAFKIEEKDLVPLHEFRRSVEAIAAGGYQSYHREHWKTFCIRQVPIAAWTKAFMQANDVPEATIAGYQKLFPEGTEIPYSIAVEGAQTIGKTPALAQ